MITLIVCLIFGVLCAVVASKKNRSGPGWFALGVLFGPIAVVLSFVLPEKA